MSARPGPRSNYIPPHFTVVKRGLHITAAQTKLQLLFEHVLLAARGQECPPHTVQDDLDNRRRAILKFMALPDFTPRVGNDPKSVKIHLTTGTGMEIEWKDGHRSAYTFTFLRDACPCALCEDERSKAGRKAGEAARLAPGALPMFKPAVKALAAEAVGKYALKFSWNDKHDLGIYSWFYLREVCPCAECGATRK
jgi:DUF971 family protein